jgi:hypothetical protein
MKIKKKEWIFNNRHESINIKKIFKDFKHYKPILFLEMRRLTEQETRTVFEKLSK